MNHHVAKKKPSASNAHRQLGKKPRAETVTKPRAKIPKSRGQPVLDLDSPVAKPEEDEILPLSGKPYFTVVLAKTHVKTAFQLILPANKLKLPSATIPAVIKYHGKTWEVLYYGNCTLKRFEPSGWKKFVMDNNLKIGDACVFELMEHRSDILKFKVQILQGDFPSELLEKTRGCTL